MLQDKGSKPKYETQTHNSVFIGKYPLKNYHGIDFRETTYLKCLWSFRQLN